MIAAAVDSVMLDVPDEEIAKTRLMNSLGSIRKSKCFTKFSELTNGSMYDSVEESKLNIKLECGKLQLYSN